MHASLSPPPVRPLPRYTVWYRFFYTGLFGLALPFLFARLAFRSWKQPAYRQRWAERLGGPGRRAVIPKSHWFHAVSLGEAVALWPTIRYMLDHTPEGAYITTTTPTGSDWVQSQIQKLPTALQNRCSHAYFPYDLPLCINRVLDRVQPRILVVMETELWWNVYHQTWSRQIPIVVINARISDKAYPRYRAVASWTRQVLQYVTWIAASSQVACERFVALGAPSERVTHIGQLKWDNPVSVALRDRGQQIRQRLQAAHTSQPICCWAAASTHPGEESLIQEAYTQLQQQYPTIRFFLYWIPRHPERFDAVYALCQAAGLSVERRSQTPFPAPTTHIYLVDTIGELPAYYAASDWAFLGGTGISIGGHNPLEALALGIPLITGPFTHGIQEVLDQFPAGCIHKLLTWDIQNWMQAAHEWVSDPAAAQTAGKTAQQICSQWIGIRQVVHDQIKALSQPTAQV